MLRNRALIPAIVLLLSAVPGLLLAQQPANANDKYQQLRRLLPIGEVLAVRPLELRRDAAAFTLNGGNVAFYTEVNGKETGAIYRGSGHVHITPPTTQERHNLSILTRSEELDEDFDELVMRFTDGTADELRKAGGGKGPDDPDYAKTAIDLQSFARKHLHDNLDLRLLADVLSPAQGGYFLAEIHSKKDKQLFFVCDPQGVSGLAPEEVALMSWSGQDEAVTYPLAFFSSDDYANGTANGNKHNASYTIANENLDVTIEKSGFLTSLATVQFRAERDGLAVVPLELYPTLRVSSVQDGNGKALDYVQEKKEEDPNFGVVLAHAMKKGEAGTLKIAFGGKDVVMNEGNANYYPVARQSWYPNASSGLGNYAMYRMVFHVPKGLQLIATGTKVTESTEGKVTTTEWRTDVPLAVVGFNLGQFTMKEATVPGKLGDDLKVDAYANTLTPDSMAGMEGGVLGTLSTTRMLPVQLSQGEVAAQIYTTYFGALPF